MKGHVIMAGETAELTLTSSNNVLSSSSFV